MVVLEYAGWTVRKGGRWFDDERRMGVDVEDGMRQGYRRSWVAMEHDGKGLARETRAMETEDNEKEEGRSEDDGERKRRMGGRGGAKCGLWDRHSETSAENGLGFSIIGAVDCRQNGHGRQLGSVGCVVWRDEGEWKNGRMEEEKEKWVRETREARGREGDGESVCVVDVTLSCVLTRKDVVCVGNRIWLAERKRKERSTCRRALALCLAVSLLHSIVLLCCVTKWICSRRGLNFWEKTGRAWKERGARQRRRWRGGAIFERWTPWVWASGPVCDAQCGLVYTV